MGRSRLSGRDLSSARRQLGNLLVTVQNLSVICFMAEVFTMVGVHVQAIVVPAAVAFPQQCDFCRRGTESGLGEGCCSVPLCICV